MESIYVSREVSPSRYSQLKVTAFINSNRSEISVEDDRHTSAHISLQDDDNTITPRSDKDSQTPDILLKDNQRPEPTKISFHHYHRINHKEAESRLKASNTEGSYLNRECRTKRGIFILSFLVNSSTIKHVVIPNKQEHLLQIEDLSTEVFSVIESMKECLVPLVLDDVANEDAAIDFIKIQVDNNHRHRFGH